MKNNINGIIVSFATGAMLLSAVAIPAFAQVGVNVNAGATVSVTPAIGVGSTASTNSAASVGAQTKIGAALITRANTEIMARITALNALNTRIGQMEKLSTGEKNILSASVQSSISAMTNLQTEINADTNNTSSLRTDFQSITKGYRIYLLVLPQGMIQAASDRVLTITSSLTDLTASLQARISAAQSAGIDMSASVSALADLKAKVADAVSQAQSAATVTASLTADNGDTAKLQSNISALKGGRTSIDAAQKDLVAARADAQKIVAAIKISEKASATAQ